jgi:hypothetical protein
MENVHGRSTPSESDLETFRLPDGVTVASADNELPIAPLSQVVGVASRVFSFRENSNTPGRFLEQSVVVNVPPGAGFFTSISSFRGSFTTRDFNFLTERPLGQFFVSAGLRGNNLVCQVRLTDSNSDDPIAITVTANILFFQ